MRNEVIFVSGQRGSGKTYWVKYFIRSLPRYLLLDTLGEYEGEPRFDDIESLLECCKNHQSLHGTEGFFEAVYDPAEIPEGQDEEEEETSDFSIFCQIALGMGNLYVIIEELDVFARSFKTPLHFQRLIKRGRHMGANVLGVSRRPAEVSRLFTSQATRFILFKQIEPRDIAYFKAVIGNTADLIPNLDRFEFLDIDFSSDDMFKGNLPQPSRLPGPILPGGLDKPENV